MDQLHLKNQPITLKNSTYFQFLLKFLLNNYLEMEISDKNKYFLEWCMIKLSWES